MHDDVDFVFFPLTILLIAFYFVVDLLWFDFKMILLISIYIFPLDSMDRWFTVFLVLCRSTNLDSWSPEQLRTMMFGGNNRAQVFFKQHGWNDGGKIEAKYTSRAADLYRQTLVKEVAKAMAEETGLSLLSSVATSQSAESSNNGFSSEPPTKESSTVKQEATTVVASSPKASQTVVASTFKKPLVPRKTGKTGGLGARKLTTKVKIQFFFL